MVQFRPEQWFNINRNKWFSMYRNNQSHQFWFLKGKGYYFIKV